MSEAKATVIVTQRERFGMTEESLASLYAHTRPPFDVVYVDSGSPADNAEFLRAESKRRGFELIRRERFITPNQARNLGWQAAKTEFVVFVDNDVLFTDGWLEALVECAEQTGAAVVAPLTCQGLPAHQNIHHAGGSYTEREQMDAFFATAPDDGRPFVEVMHGHGDDLDSRRDDLVRGETGMCEFHCALARRDVFERIGPLDEQLLSTKEHIDFSMSVRAAGEKVYFEPSSVVTYVFPCRARPLVRADWPFFALRWSDEFGRRSLNHFIKKWQLKMPPDYVHVRRETYKMRRKQGILIPMMRKIPYVGQKPVFTNFAAKLLAPIEQVINRTAVAVHDRRAQRAH